MKMIQTRSIVIANDLKQSHEIAASSRRAELLAMTTSLCPVLRLSRISDFIKDTIALDASLREEDV